MQRLLYLGLFIYVTQALCAANTLNELKKALNNEKRGEYSQSAIFTWHIDHLEKLISETASREAVLISENGTRVKNTQKKNMLNNENFQKSKSASYSCINRLDQDKKKLLSFPEFKILFLLYHKYNQYLSQLYSIKRTWEEFEALDDPRN